MTIKRVVTDGVLVFPCPKCDETLEVGLHVVDVAFDSKRKSGITGTTYSHRVEFVAEAPHLHAEFWGHMVRCHQPHPHPYMSPQEPEASSGPLGVVGSADSPTESGEAK